MRIDISSLTNEDVLAGAGNGAYVLSELVRRAARADGPIAYLDLAKVRIMTASFFREFALGFRDYCRRSRPDLSPVVANANDDTLDEITFVLHELRDSFVLCELKAGGKVDRPRVVGVLDEKQRLTLEAVVRLGEADAGMLKERFPDESIGLTGWNNRLAALSDKCLVREARFGRSKRYYPVLEGLHLGR